MHPPARSTHPELLPARHAPPRSPLHPARSTLPCPLSVIPALLTLSWNVLLTGKGVDSDAHGRAFIPKVLCQ